LTVGLYVSVINVLEEEESVIGLFVGGFGARGSKERESMFYRKIREVHKVWVFGAKVF